jgi:hypothetical protein
VRKNPTLSRKSKRDVLGQNTERGERSQRRKVGSVGIALNAAKNEAESMSNPGSDEKK